MSFPAGGGDRRRGGTRPGAGDYAGGDGAVVAEVERWWRAGDLLANCALTELLGRAGVKGEGLDDVGGLRRGLRAAVHDGGVRAELVEWCAIVAERRGGRDDRNPRLWLADVTEHLSRPFGAGAVAGEVLEELRRAVTAADAALAAARPQPEMVHPDDEMLTLLDNYSRARARVLRH
ncbi:hypothetical protein [Rhodococcus jostii]|uniref:Uncharacterized protein n=1 Tax=Rhodococcus jostii TaxID=132919 RepID=A0A1H4QZ94_RHOJO|nr:hypothetical protein [Rhodococcus jostii]SEC24966.1 hypothetical protein SAMN04490220_1163 [Rhodococcus jostii]